MHTIYSWWKTWAVTAAEADMTVGAEWILHKTMFNCEQASRSLNFHLFRDLLWHTILSWKINKLKQMNKLLFTCSIHKVFCYTIIHPEVVCPEKWNVSWCRLRTNSALIDFIKGSLQLWTSCSCDGGSGEMQFPNSLTHEAPRQWGWQIYMFMLF